MGGEKFRRSYSNVDQEREKEGRGRGREGEGGEGEKRTCPKSHTELSPMIIRVCSFLARRVVARI